LRNKGPEGTRLILPKPSVFRGSVPSASRSDRWSRDPPSAGYEKEFSIRQVQKKVEDNRSTNLWSMKKLVRGSPLWRGHDASRVGDPTQRDQRR
jgi:hypothetical protein